MAAVDAGDPNAPILLHFVLTCTSLDAKKTVLASLQTSVDYQLSSQPNVLTYHFSTPSTDSLDITLLEVYATENAFWAHTEPEHISNALSQLMTPEIRETARGVGVGKISPRVHAAVQYIKGVSKPLIAGYIDGTAVRSLIRSTASAKPVLCTIRLPNLCKDATKAREAINLIKSKIFSNVSLKRCTTTCALYETPYQETLEITIIACDAAAMVDSLCSMRHEFKNLQRLTPSFAMEFSEGLDGDLQAQLKNCSLPVSTSCNFAGYVLHPKVLEKHPQVAFDPGSHSKQKSAAPPPPPPPSMTPKARVQQPESTGVSCEYYSVNRNAYTDEIQSVHFPKSLKNPHPTDDGNLYVPLIHVARKLTGKGAMELDLPMDILFGQLERFRFLQRSVKLLQRVSCIPIGDRTARDMEYVETFLEQMHDMGFTLRANDKTLTIPGLPDLIKLIESEYQAIISETRANLDTDQRLPYKGLQELFHIGSCVVGPGPSGIRVAFRITDAYFWTTRSMMGGRKFVFKMGLQFLVSVGREYAQCGFEENFEEWEGLHHVGLFPYQPLNEEDEVAFAKRGKMVDMLGTTPTFRAYSARSFFPHQQVKPGSIASSSGPSMKAVGSGRAMIDNYRGLMLGHAPGSSYENSGIAITATLKVYRSVERSTREGDSAQARAERLKTAQLVLLQVLPDASSALVWPAVVAFSFTSKCWGHVLVDGISPVSFSNEPWENLVLPARTKEMLLAMSSFWITGDSKVFRDVVSGKNSGQLFLLYGPPGTGKTLTVEALAERFKRPLYALSFGELGTNVGELEETITNVLNLCSEWNAFVLLDEGDALVEKRKHGQLLLNSLVGVLLRTLDRFEGQMFITSNRLESFDPAALNRVTLAIKYEPITKEGLQKVWRNLLQRVQADVTLFDLEKLSDHRLSGREINAVCRLGLALSKHRGLPFGQEVIDDALEISNDFRKDFPAQEWE